MEQRWSYQLLGSDRTEVRAVIGRTLTKSFAIETRQHELLGLDLGEGPPRKLLVLGGIFVGSWFGIASLLFGWPNRATFLLYVTIPVVLAVYGFRESKNPRRRNVVVWWLKAHFLLRGYSPIIALGQRYPDRTEVRSIADRFDIEGILKFLNPTTVPKTEWETELPPEKPVGARKSVPINTRIRFLGGNDVQRP